MSWFMYSISAAIVLTVHFLLLKKASIHGISLNLLIMYMWGFSTIILFAFQFLKKQIALPKGSFIIVLLAGATALIGTWLLNKGVYLAPNPGYATAVGSLQVLMVLIISIFVFGSEFSLIKAGGSILIVLGVILLSL